MRQELEQKLFDEFPEMFRGHESGDPRQTLIVFGFGCNDGWFDLLYDLCKDIKKIAEEEGITDEFTVVQVKEKFAGLRFYIYGASEAIYQRILKAEELSYKTCELCGGPGIPFVSNFGWYKILCKDCASQDPKRGWEIVKRES